MATTNFEELMLQRAEKEGKKLEDALAVLIKHSNIMNPAVELGDVMHNMMTKEHRTIQQSFMRSVYHFLESYANERSDLRNKASVNFAKKAVKLECNFPFI